MEVHKLKKVFKIVLTKIRENNDRKLSRDVLILITV